MGNGEWGMGNGEWGTGNGEWGMGNGEGGMGNGEWGIGNGVQPSGLVGLGDGVEFNLKGGRRIAQKIFFISRRCY